MARENALSSQPARLTAVDVFRGMTIVAMILVNNPGDWATIYWPLKHAEWHGCTPTDLVFPFFLFIVGVAIVLALGRRIEAGSPRRPPRNSTAATSRPSASSATWTTNSCG